MVKTDYMVTMYTSLTTNADIRIAFSFAHGMLPLRYKLTLIILVKT